MKTNKFISATILASALALSSVAMAQQITIPQAKVNTVTSSIASILYKRGIEEESAYKISDDFIDMDEDLFALMIFNLESGCGVLSESEILNYLSSSALRKQKVELTSYSFLIGMAYAIKSKTLSSKTQSELKKIAQKNARYM